MNEIFNKYSISVVFGIMVFTVAYMNANRFLEWLRWQSIGTRDYIVEKWGLMFVEVTPNRVLLIMIATSLLPALLMFWLVMPTLIPAVIIALAVAVAMWFVPKAVTDMMFNRRVELFNTQMVDGLGLMANGMKSGLSIVQAIGMVKNEMPNPFSQELDYVLKQNQLGISVEDAFQNLATRIGSEDVNMFVTAVVILKETGGNLAETFETIVLVIRERIKVEKKISAMMRQNLAQGTIVAMMPFALLAMFYFSDEGFLMPMFQEPMGWALLAVAFIFWVLGVVTIYKVVQIKV
ncbi:MAG TPA: type II secretion system F family protein [Bdellovibrionota bacterium]|jgi:tight adherence protein B